jgi:hypothetical protein
VVVLDSVHEGCVDIHNLRLCRLSHIAITNGIQVSVLKFLREVCVGLSTPLWLYQID